MTIYAKCRDYSKYDSFAYMTVSSLNYACFECDETLYPCWQPDELDDSNFNTVILLNGYPVLVQSIDFDFVDIED
jgi:hypothetical protein